MAFQSLSTSMDASVDGTCMHCGRPLDDHSSYEKKTLEAYGSCRDDLQSGPNTVDPKITRIRTVIYCICLYPLVLCPLYFWVFTLLQGAIQTFRSLNILQYDRKNYQTRSHEFFEDVNDLTHPREVFWLRIVTWSLYIFAVGIFSGMNGKTDKHQPLFEFTAMSAALILSYKVSTYKPDIMTVGFPMGESAGLILSSLFHDYWAKKQVEYCQV